ncbi:hypothetical protein SUGI_1229240 [Cryptomeria japonica]|uniref:Uncharacterized protein n=1 Tax=Cryptomeria japonica TaxID=3369 RepID=A0AAD3RNY0_CRYJA|nr:hypothetical protein SUGI_1229240 [Cryptomeria japonica]
MIGPIYRHVGQRSGYLKSSHYQPAYIIWLGLAGINNWIDPMETGTATRYGSWPRQCPPLFIHIHTRMNTRDKTGTQSWAAVNRSDREVVPSLVPNGKKMGNPFTMLLRSDPAGEQSQSAFHRQRKEAALCSLLLHQAREFGDRCRSVATRGNSDSIRRLGGTYLIPIARRGSP